MVELLVVIAIIAIIASITVPAIQNGLAYSRSAKCVSNLRTLAAACNLYRADKGHYPQGNYTVDTVGWQDQLARAGYLDRTNTKARTLNCPEFNKVPNPPSTLLNGQRPNIIYSYWINPTQFRAEQNANDTSMVRSLSGRSSVLIMDGAGVNAGMNLFGFTNTVFPSADMVRMTFRHGGRLSSSEQASWTRSKPYPGKMHIAFQDGHVESATVPVGSTSAPENAGNVFAQPERW